MSLDNQVRWTSPPKRSPHEAHEDAAQARRRPGHAARSRRRRVRRDRTRKKSGATARSCCTASAASRRRPRKVPLLISYALVNRPYMVDLQADRSIVRGLLARGEDVYIIDWGYPDRSDRYLTLEDYIERFLGGAVDHLRREHGLDAINLLGICQGGAFSLCYASLHPDKIRNLITMVTPVDFHTDDNMLSNWTRGMDVDLFVDTLGNVPADLMNWCYLTLKPCAAVRAEVRRAGRHPRRQEGGRGFPAHGEVDLRFARPGRRSVPPVRQAVLPGQRLRQRRHRHRRPRSAPGHGRDAGAQHLRRAGPPGAAGGVEARCAAWSAPTTTPSCRSRAATSASTCRAARRRKCRTRSTTGSLAR